MSVRGFLAVALATACAGCGDSGGGRAVISGKLLDDGKPFVTDAVKLRLPKGTSLPPGTVPLQITFIPEERGEMYITTITDQATGGFRLTGTDGKGVKPGKYKVGIQVNTGPGTPDALRGKYSAEKTPIQVELKAGEEVVIDLAKVKG